MAKKEKSKPITPAVPFDASREKKEVLETSLKQITKDFGNGIVKKPDENTLIQSACPPEQTSVERVKTIRVPIVGRVVCGYPGDAEEYIEGYLPLPSAWLKGDSFALIAYGDSMVDAGICAGDFLLLTRTCEAPDGKIVSVWTEDGATLKRIGTENGKRVLYAENKAYPPEKSVIRPREMRIQGILTKVIHDV